MMNTSAVCGCAGILPPDQFDPSVQPNWTVDDSVAGQVSIDLQSDYRVDVIEAGAQVIITNEKTGEVTRVHGDPHVDVNGRRQFDFYEDATFTLDDGTKITIQTDNAGNNTTLASRVVITRGDQGVVVHGVDPRQPGDLRAFQTTDQGQLLDLMVADGNRFFENVNDDVVGWTDANGDRLNNRSVRDIERGSEDAGVSNINSQELVNLVNSMFQNRQAADIFTMLQSLTRGR